MTDYIKRTDALEIINNNLSRFMIALRIGDCQSADVAPVRHGHWIEYGENEDGTHNICCSVCDGFFKSKGHANSCYTRNKYRYCHNCGARMDGENDE